MKNLEFIAENTNEEVQFGINEFADLSSSEFGAIYLKAVPHKQKSKKQEKKYYNEIRNITIPTSVDWTTAGAVAPVKNQGACGSCWAFSAIGAIESAYAITNKMQVPLLSEEQLVQCAGSVYGNEGCGGGWMNASFQYAAVHGICLGSLYPYTSGNGVTGKCKVDVEAQGNYTVVDYSDVPEGNCLALNQAVVNQPISVAVDALAWQLYIGGTMPHGVCGHKLDHGVLLTGYTENYWIIKNSWGKGWGIQGYIHVAKGDASDNA
jgi:C1A family cysteine protease